MTTDGMLDDCIGTLMALREEVSWEIENPPSPLSQPVKTR